MGSRGRVPNKPLIMVIISPGEGGGTVLGKDGFEHRAQRVLRRSLSSGERAYMPKRTHRVLCRSHQL